LTALNETLIKQKNGSNKLNKLKNVRLGRQRLGRFAQVGLVVSCAMATLTQARAAQGAAAAVSAASAASASAASGDAADASALPASSIISGRLLLTQGVSNVEGSAGGGLTPWAVISGYSTQKQVGGNVHDTYIRTQDYALNTYGVAVGIGNRVEVSLAKQTLDTRNVGTTLGLGAGYKLNLDIVGLKVRLLGDAVLDQDTWVPQVSVGLQYKHNEQGNVVAAVGGASSSGTDFYVTATKLFLAQSLLASATLRMTKANQFGLLGFGGDNNNRYQPEFEGSLAYLLSKQVAIGAEYRTKPNNLSFAAEQNSYDAFLAWTINKYVSLTAAYVELGDIATIKNQHGFYLSAQVGF
jgi:hypothetical protein